MPDQRNMSDGPVVAGPGSLSLPEDPDGSYDEDGTYTPAESEQTAAEASDGDADTPTSEKSARRRQK